ncbi:hypothetical protein [Dysgonomonas sp. 511]|uniref:hypothetical protein n=1 Tax=Dysgonomonas sp. 511 TaxID=2302930 RepID=UPI0013D0BDDF|nr:hypothetical protein [Dysgonomonas sp. 511]NDV78393.1 hypothetical protein [Dysgonomonas sp. 511]
MKHYILIFFFSTFIFSLTAQDEPAIKKLPVKISVFNVDIDNKTGERNEKLEDEYILDYDREYITRTFLEKYKMPVNELVSGKI